MRRTALLLLAAQLAVRSAAAQGTPDVTAPPFRSNPVILQASQTTTTSRIPVGRPGQPAAATATGTAALDPATASAPLKENLFTFDPQSAEVIWNNQHWQLTAGGQTLKDFGRREVEAYLALRVLRDLRLSQRGVIGGAEPVMEYWLSDGHAPYSAPPGLHVTPLDQSSLRVEPVRGQWCVRDDQRVLLNCADRAGDAQQALAAMKKYGFTQVGVIGQAGAMMLVFFARAGDGPGANGQAAPAARTAPPLQKPGAKPSGADASPVVTPAIAPLSGVSQFQKKPLTNFGRGAEGDAARPQHPASLYAGTPGADEYVERTPFDFQRVQLRKDGSHWTLAAGGLVVARFAREQDARLAVTAIQHYRFTELDFVGRPQPFCSFFLSDGMAPRGVLLGLNSESFAPEKLAVSAVEGRWVVGTPDRPLLWFGERPEEARAMLDVLRREQFDRLCHIGAPDEPGLTFFVRSR